MILQYVFKNLQKEAKGIEINEYLYQEVQKIKLKSKNSYDCYVELTHKLHFPKEEYFTRLKQAMNIWIQQFK